MSALVFCIGGPYGHSDAVRARADLTLRLSACVLNHQVPLFAGCTTGACNVLLLSSRKDVGLSRQGCDVVRQMHAGVSHGVGLLAEEHVAG